MSSLQAPLMARAGSIPTYVNPIIGVKAVHAPLPPAILMDYWRGLLNPALRQLPEPLLANQLEEVQAALRDVLYLLQEINHAS